MSDKTGAYKFDEKKHKEALKKTALKLKKKIRGEAKKRAKSDIFEKNFDKSESFKNKLDQKKLMRGKTKELIKKAADQGVDISKMAAKKSALQALKSGGKKAAGLAAVSLLGKVLLPAAALAGEALGVPKAGVPVDRDIAGGIKQGKLPGKLRDATMGALDDITRLRAKKKRKNLVEK